MSDAATLGKDIAADASQKAANQVRPSEEDLAQIDQAAEDNVWHEKPNINKDDLKSKFKRNKAVCFPRIFPSEQVLTSFQDKESIASASIAENQSAVESTTSNKSKTKEYADKTKGYLADKVPKERREQTVWRLKKMIIEIQGHADCKLNEPILY